MAGLEGLDVFGSYTAIDVGAANLAEVQGLLDELLAVIPNPEIAPAQAVGGMLDEMSAAAALQLRREIGAARAVVTGT